jgi:uncharacterized protein YdeI (YjbR/CyaY-like superfamily)
MRNQQIDNFIDNAAEFAQPVLIYMRELIHEACPQIVESIKWGMPSFDYKGPLIVMGAFKKHMAINFWKAQLLADTENLFIKSGDSMGGFGKLTSIKQLAPREILLAYIYEAIDLKYPLIVQESYEGLVLYNFGVVVHSSSKILHVVVIANITFFQT